MAKTGQVDITPGLEDSYYSELQTMDRFIIPRIKPKKGILSRRRKRLIRQRSLLPQISTLWTNLSDAQQQAWKDTDPHSQQHGWREFVSDTALRIQLELAGVATPNEYHHGLVGKILIQAPAEEIKLAQYHPASYWVYRKVEGKDSMFEPSEVTESFATPLIIAISFKSDLTSTGEGSFAKFYGTVRHLYQGQNLDYNLEIDIPLQSAWDRIESALYKISYYGHNQYAWKGYGEEYLGPVIFYDLYIHLYKVTGTLLIDNIKAEHSAANWVRDPFCEAIDRTFNRQFYLIPDNWKGITVPTGAAYSSIYPT